MQIATQIIAQRATPATRTTTTSTTKTRWQPYIQPTASTSMLPTRSPYLHTPSPTQFQPGSEASTSRSCPPATPQTPKESLQSKQKYALGLIGALIVTNRRSERQPLTGIFDFLSFQIKLSIHSPTSGALTIFRKLSCPQRCRENNLSKHQTLY